jgi:excisionase family DNA binding protein
MPDSRGDLVPVWSPDACAAFRRPVGMLSRLSLSRPFLTVHVLRHLEGQVIMNGTLAADEIRRLPAALTVIQAARLLGIGRSSDYQAVKAGTWPTRVLRVGRTIRIPCAEVLALLGIDTDQMRGSQS